MKGLAPLMVAASVAGLSAAEIQVPFEKYQLKNGMRVILSQDNAVPVVAIYVIYGVGARSEEKGRSGFAHLFEHMMFQGSANAPKGMHFKTVESNGGSLNGSTHPDFTDYFEVLPSNKLAVGLWLEADRMRSLAITEENLQNQKDAVKEERRLTFDNRPYNTAIVDRWPELAFRNWQNSHSLIGSYEDLEAATVEDVANFFRTYYAPNNAVLAVVGDISIPEAKKWIDTYFADIEPQPQPKHPDMAEPPLDGPRSAVVKDPLARVPGVIIGYPGPKRRSEDFYALIMADVALTAGDSSRFQQNLVKGKKAVIQYQADLGWPFASPNDYIDPGFYSMFLLHLPNVPAREIVAQVNEEIARLANDGISDAEIGRLRTFLKAARLTEIQTSLGRAKLLGQYELFDGDPSLIAKELEALLKVTPDQLQAAAAKYLTPERQIVMEVVPAPPARPSGE
ncbi:MAG: insulinase family protein [Bryobacterales bacterium]|nr:insulinase family protein [Bryobacterales bacterium]